MIPKTLPDKFLERLRVILPSTFYAEALERMSALPLFSVRVNTLKIPMHLACRFLADAGIAYEHAADLPEAVCFSLEQIDIVRALDQFVRGEFYQQSVASMLAVAVLDPQPGERILDLCAAPGSKTSQIAARMNNAGSLTAVEAIRSRFYKLKAVLRLLGVENTDCLCMDGRRFEARGELFDRVLIDAPCSSEGRFRLDKPKTFAYWSLRKIKEMVKKQRGLLLNAGRQVKPGGVMVYSTCTFAPEENEAVVDWFLRKSDGAFTVEPVCFSDVPVYPAVLSWEGKTFDPQIERCVRILPGRKTEGFFIGKFRKI
jgi:16S rRNA (cytosine1407-C5)-methyltransferase